MCNLLLRVYVVCVGSEVDKKLKVNFKSISCKVCNAPSSGFHFGAITCEGCKVLTTLSDHFDCIALLSRIYLSLNLINFFYLTLVCCTTIYLLYQKAFK